MWILIILAVHLNDSKDVPGRVELTFQDQHTCLQALGTIKYKLKFDNFKKNDILMYCYLNNNISYFPIALNLFTNAELEASFLSSSIFSLNIYLNNAKTPKPTQMA